MSINRIIRRVIPATDFISKVLMKRQLNKRMQTCLSGEVLKQYEAGDISASKVYKSLSGKYPKKTGQLLEECRSMAESIHQTFTEEMGMDAVICYYGYGFEIDEYIGFDLYTKEIKERREYLSNRDRGILNIGLNNIFDRSKVGYKDTAYEYFKKYYKRNALHVSKSNADQFAAFLKKYGAAVIKDPIGANGKDVSFLQKKDVADPKKYFAEHLKGKELFIEQPIKQSAQMAAFNESSVNTVRIVCLNTDRGPEILHCVLRVGRNGSFVDNASTGGLFALVDVKKGIVVGNGQDTNRFEHEVHPESGVQFKGYELPEWDKAIALTRKITKMLPRVKYISWDLTHTDAGWVIVEGNEGGRLRMVQMAEGHGIKEEFVSIIRNRIDAPLKQEVLKALGEDV